MKIGKNLCGTLAEEHRIAKYSTASKFDLQSQIKCHFFSENPRVLQCDNYICAFFRVKVFAHFLKRLQKTNSVGQVRPAEQRMNRVFFFSFSQRFCAAFFLANSYKKALSKKWGKPETGEEIPTFTWKTLKQRQQSFFCLQKINIFSKL